MALCHWCAEFIPAYDYGALSRKKLVRLTVAAGTWGRSAPCGVIGEPGHYVFVSITGSIQYNSRSISKGPAVFLKVEMPRSANRGAAKIYFVGHERMAMSIRRNNWSREAPSLARVDMP